MGEFNDFAYEQLSPEAEVEVQGKPMREREERPKREKKKWAVSEMQSRHQIIKRMLFEGWSNKEIAERDGISPQQVSNIKNSPIVKEKLEMMHKAADAQSLDVQREIMEVQPYALMVLKEAIKNGTIDGEPITASQRLKECNTAVDRHIGRPTQTVKTQNLNMHFSSDELKAMRERAMKSAMKTAVPSLE